MSATTWPDPAVELVCAWQALCPVVQLAVVVEAPSGGPRAPFAPFIEAGPSLPAAEVRVVPEQFPADPAQSSVAEAIVQLDAPGTVGPPEFALEPGAVGAGGVAGWSWPGCPWSAGCSPPVVPSVTVAFAVERACTSGAMMLASGPEEAPEFVTAWQTPPVTPSQEPSLCEPRGSGEIDGSVAVAALDTFPLQVDAPSQVSAAPAADAADGPAVRRAVLMPFGSPFASVWVWEPARASAAPDPVEACDTDCTWQSPVPAVHEAVPVDVRGVPPLTAPSQAAVLVFTVPEQFAPAAQDRLALDEEVEVGPLVGWPGTGSPVAGSITT
jgi:hypothetical protein